MANKLQLKRNKNEAFNKENYPNMILQKGEPLYDNVAKLLYIGDGITPFSKLEPIRTAMKVESIIDSINDDSNSSLISSNKIQMANSSSTLTDLFGTGEDSNAALTAIIAKTANTAETAASAQTAETSNSTKKIIGNKPDEYYDYAKLVDAINDAAATGGVPGATGPTGPTGPAGTSITVKATALECTQIGDGYINNKDGHLMILTSTDPRTFTDGGQIKGDTGPMGPSGKDGRDGVDGVGREGPTGPAGTVSANSGTNLPTTANEGDIFFLYVVS